MAVQLLSNAKGPLITAIPVAADAAAPTAASSRSSVEGALPLKEQRMNTVDAFLTKLGNALTMARRWSRALRRPIALEVVRGAVTSVSS
jgi:hypothetical protein